jgi:hypothetical protein
LQNLLHTDVLVAASIARPAHRTVVEVLDGQVSLRMSRGRLFECEGPTRSTVQHMIGIDAARCAGEVDTPSCPLEVGGRGTG